MVSTAGLFIDSRVAFSLNRRRENGLKINSGHSLFLAAPAELCWETTGARWLGFFLTEDSLRKAPASCGFGDQGLTDLFSVIRARKCLMHCIQIVRGSPFMPLARVAAGVGNKSR